MARRALRVFCRARRIVDIISLPDVCNGDHQASHPCERALCPPKLCLDNHDTSRNDCNHYHGTNSVRGQRLYRCGIQSRDKSVYRPSWLMGCNYVTNRVLNVKGVVLPEPGCITCRSQALNAAFSVGGVCVSASFWQLWCSRGVVFCSAALVYLVARWPCGLPD